MVDKLSSILFSPISLQELEILIENSVRRALSEVESNKAADNILTIEEASRFINLKKQTLYQLVSKRKIPFMKQGKKLHFSKDDLMSWLKTSARKVKK